MRAESFDDSTHYVALWRENERWGREEDEEASESKQTRSTKAERSTEGDADKLDFNIFGQLQRQRFVCNKADNTGQNTLIVKLY